ncbi:hypothetical protein CVU37_04925 [candidate division BRC1 bacterium HGW-BRC1-1]|nr:MAG: hypothetical protein CVU37_04925 [candidate division BRC1 bacterium HGW-BRC1-1]
MRYGKYILAVLAVLALTGTAHAAYGVRVDESIPDARLPQVQSVLAAKGWEYPAGRTIGVFNYWPEAAYAALLYDFIFQKTGL